MMGNHAMLESTEAQYSAQYFVRNLPSVSRTLQGLPEFSRTRLTREFEEFVWMVPSYQWSVTVAEPVATVKLGRDSLRIECHTRHALRAMQVLFDSLVGTELELVSSSTAVSKA